MSWCRSSAARGRLSAHGLSFSLRAQAGSSPVASNGEAAHSRDPQQPIDQVKTARHSRRADLRGDPPCGGPGALRRHSQAPLLQSLRPSSEAGSGQANDAVAEVQPTKKLWLSSVSGGGRPPSSSRSAQSGISVSCRGHGPLVRLVGMGSGVAAARLPRTVAQRLQIEVQIAQACTSAARWSRSTAQGGFHPRHAAHRHSSPCCGTHGRREPRAPDGQRRCSIGT
jgi:hypothetical protein